MDKAGSHPQDGLGRRLVHYTSVWLAALIGIAASLVLFFQIQASDRATLLGDLASMAADRAQAIQSRLEEDSVEAQLAASYVLASNELAAGDLGSFSSEFAKVVGRIPRLEPDTTLVAFAARVEAPARSAFESRGRVEIDAGFRIADRGPTGDPVAAAPRSEYFPIVAVAPSSFDAALLGLDLASSPQLRSTMDRAMGNGAVSASEIIPLPFPDPDKPSLWRIIAVYRHGETPGTRQPRSDLLGLVAVSIRVDLFIENSFASLSPAGMDFELSDPSAPADRRTVYVHKSRSVQPSQDSTQFHSLSWKTTLDIGNRKWTFTAYPASRFMELHRSAQSWIVLAGGVALTLAIAGFFLSRLLRAGRVEALITQRTEELAQEIGRHRELEAELVDSRAALSAQVSLLNQGSQEMRLLNEMGDTLQSCVSVEESFPVIGLYMPRLLPGSSGALFMREGGSETFAPTLEWGQLRTVTGPFTAEACWGLRRGKLHAVGPTLLAVPCTHSMATEGLDSLCIPLAANGRTFGLFNLVGSGEETHTFAQSIADRVGLALSNLMLRSDLRQLSIRDPLTGLFNRRYMEEALETELRRAERTGATVGVIMLDIDHFKSFNDELGHAAGDQLLASLGGLVQGILRAGDIACRYGGEEFLLILPEASATAAASRAESLRQAVGTLSVSVPGKEPRSATISLGVAVFPVNAADRDGLLSAADAGLYRAKSTGRNRVVVAGQ